MYMYGNPTLFSFLEACFFFNYSSFFGSSTGEETGGRERGGNRDGFVQAGERGKKTVPVFFRRFFFFYFSCAGRGG